MARGDENTHLIQDENGNRDKQLAYDIWRRDNGSEYEIRHEGMAAVGAQKVRSHKAQSGQKVDKNGELEHETSPQRYVSHSFYVGHYGNPRLDIT
jgi:hypothetical protein